MRVFLVIFLLLAAPVRAETIWQRVMPGDAMYNPELDMAALVQADGTFAVVIPDPNSPGALVGFGLLAEGYADTVMSILTIGSGRVSQREVAVPELIWRGNALDGAVTYLFPISAEEVELFKSGQTWRVVVQGDEITFPLTGSRIAITEAEAAKAARAEMLRQVSGD